MNIEPRFSPERAQRRRHSPACPAHHTFARWRRAVLLIGMFATATPARAAPNAATQRVDLALRRVTDPEFPIVAAAQRLLVARDKATIPAKTLPKDLHPKSEYFVFELRGRAMTIIVEPAAPELLHVDRDGDGDLAHHTPVEGLPVRRRLGAKVITAHRFPPTTIAIDQRDDRLPVEVYFEHVPPGQLIVYPAHYREGRIVLAALSYRVALVDNTYDGRYDDPCTPPVARCDVDQWDCMAIDQNRNNRYDHVRWGYWEIQPVTPRCLVGENAFDVDVAPDGSSLTLTPAEIEYGSIQAPMPGAELLLVGEYGFMHLGGRTGAWRVPVGHYACWAAIVQRRDPHGNVWTLRNVETGKALFDVEARPDDLTDLAVGGALQPVESAAASPGSRTANARRTGAKTDRTSAGRLSSGRLSGGDAKPTRPQTTDQGSTGAKSARSTGASRASRDLAAWGNYVDSGGVEYMPILKNGHPRNFQTQHPRKRRVWRRRYG
jgi:hypothetical protein